MSSRPTAIDDRANPAPDIATPSRAPRLEVTIAWLALLGLAMLVCGTALLALHLRERIMDEAEARAADTARVLAEHAARLLDAADLLVARAVEEVEDKSWSEVETSQDVWVRLRNEEQRFPFLAGLWLSDDAGRLRLATVQFPVPAANTADREYFNALRKGGKAPYISGLIVGRITHQPSFLLAHRLAAVDGTFRGTAAVSIEPGYFEDFYRSLDVPYEPVIILYRTDALDVLVRYPDPNPSAPYPLPESEVAAIRANPPGGRFRDDRLVFAYRALGNWPVAVAVRLNVPPAVAAWRAALWPYLVVAAGGAAALLGLAAFGFRQAHAARVVQRDLERRVRDRTASLETALAERNAVVARQDLLMREVNHRVKNSLQVVSSLLALHGQTVTDDEARRQLEEAGRRVRAVSDIHQLLYRVEDVEAIPFHEYLTTLCRDLERSALEQQAAWRLELDVEPALVPTDRAVPLGLIANELVMNAVKHAYPGDGPKPISVSLHRVNGSTLRLTVADRGVGMPDGFDWRRGRSLGMRVVHALVGQLGAAIEAEPNDPGSRFHVTVPIEGRRD